MRGAWACRTRVGRGRSGWRSWMEFHRSGEPSTTSPRCRPTASTWPRAAARSPPTRPGRSSRQELRELAEHLLGVLDDIAGGVPAVLVATAVGLALPAPVLLPGVARVVEPVAAQLDGQVVGGPAAVDP